MTLRRGSVPFDGERRLRYEVATAEGASRDWGLVWAHGLHSSVASESEGGWPFWGVPGLADVMPVTRFDARGHGGSDAAPSPPTWLDMGQDLGLLARSWGRRRTVLGGTSMGCAACLYAAVEGQLDIGGLILATPPTCYDARRNFLPLYTESLEMARSRGLQAAKDAAEKKTRPPIFSESAAARAMFEVGWRQKLSMGAERYCAALEGAAASDLPGLERLREIRVPTLILAWKSDAQHPREAAEMLHEAIPGSSLVLASSWAEVEQFPVQMRNFLGRLVETS